MTLHEARDALVEMGYVIASESDDETVGVRHARHWDVLGTDVTYVVFLRAVTSLSAADIASQTAALIERAHALDAHAGLNHRLAIVPVYFADSVDTDAGSMLESKSPAQVAEFLFPVALERPSGNTYYLRDARVWGAGYTAKLRYLAQKLVEPTLAPEKEPLSGAGIGFSVALVVMTLCLIGLMGAACWLFQQG